MGTVLLIPQNQRDGSPDSEAENRPRVSYRKSIYQNLKPPTIQYSIKGMN